MSYLPLQIQPIVQDGMDMLNFHLAKLVRMAQLELDIDSSVLYDMATELREAANLTPGRHNGAAGVALVQLYHQLLPQLDLIQDAIEDHPLSYDEIDLLLQGEAVAGERAQSERRLKRHQERLLTDKAYKERHKERQKMKNEVSEKARKARRLKQRVGRGARINKPPELRRAPPADLQLDDGDGNVIRLSGD